MAKGGGQNFFWRAYALIGPPPLSKSPRTPLPMPFKADPLSSFFNEGSSLTIVNEGSSLTIANEELSLTIVFYRRFHSETIVF